MARLPPFFDKVGDLECTDCARIPELNHEVVNLPVVQFLLFERCERCGLSGEPARQCRNCLGNHPREVTEHPRGVLALERDFAAETQVVTNEDSGSDA